MAATLGSPLLFQKSERSETKMTGYLRPANDAAESAHG
jgi:hypothetical protein